MRGPCAIRPVATTAALLMLLAAAGAGCGGGDSPADDGERPSSTAGGGGEDDAGGGRGSDGGGGGEAAAGGGAGSAAAEPPPVRPQAIDHGPRKGRRVALTFDADMTPAMQAEARSGGSDSYEREIVRKLRRWNVAATIFLTGLWAETHPDAVEELARGELFELGSHSHDHSAWTEDCYGLPAVSSQREKRRQVTRPARIIEELAGHPPHWFRFPGLCHEPADVELVATLGQQVVDGDVSSGDAFNPDARAVADSVLEGVRPGSIVVMHLHGAPNAPATSAALDLIVPELRRRGYRFVTLTELLGD